jgi:UDP-N-acetylmuramoyl-tripeptide--D-alanyl-D-alanine ligase
LRDEEELISVREVLRATGGRLIQGNSKGRFSGVSLDSRTIRPGSLFIPLIGERFNGHRFISQALEKGARGFLINVQERSRGRDSLKEGGIMIEVKDTLVALGDLAHLWRKKHPIPLVAITGSNGKTTTREMLAEILKIKFKILKTEGNFNNLIGVPLTLLRLRKQDEVAILEMGMNQSQEIKRLAEISQPTIGLITNISFAHVEKLGTLAAVTQAKGELIEFLGKDGLIVVNADDPNVLKLAQKSRSKKITFGIESPSDLTVRDISFCGTKETKFWLSLGGEEIEISLGISGFHNIYNALAAAAAGVAFRVEPQIIKEGLENFRPFRMRTEIFHLKGGIVLINDTYNANPRSMDAALRMLVELKGKKRGIAILGDMFELGSHAQKAHDELGALAQDISVDFLFAFGKYGRIVGQKATEQGMDEDRVFFSEDLEEIVSRVEKIVKHGDRILVKGSRGMKMERIVEKIILKFGIDN